MNVLVIVPATLTRHEEETGVLSPVQGAPLIGPFLDRLATVDKLEAVVVTTGDDPEDAAIMEIIAPRAGRCVSAAWEDLLGRLLSALKAAGAKGGVMLGARNPLMDPALVDQVMDLLRMTDGMLDWIGNTLSPSYPRGMEIDGFTACFMLPKAGEVSGWRRASSNSSDITGRAERRRARSSGWRAFGGVDRRPRGTPEMCHASRRAAASVSGLTIGSEQTVPRQT